MNKLFRRVVRGVALRAIELTGASALRLSSVAKAFHKKAGREGHHRIVRWRVNKLFSKAVREVALRAMGLTGASALRLW